MKAGEPYQLKLVSDYVALLARYARMLTRNEVAANDLLQMALSEVISQELAMPSAELRERTRRCLREFCFSYNLAQDAVCFKGRAITEDDL